MSFAALAELIISARCLDNHLEEAPALLRSLDEHSPSSVELANSAAPGDGDEEDS